MASDTDRHFAFPKLYGAPAYARPPRIVADAERPFDPDDLPIVADMTEEERSFATTLEASGTDLPADGAGRTSGDGDGAELAARRLSLRSLAGRLGSRPK